jgi:hypothetical protein
MIKSYALPSGAILVSRGYAKKHRTVQPTKPSSYAVCETRYKTQLQTHFARHLASGTDIPIPLKITKPDQAKLARMWLEFLHTCQM